MRKLTLVILALILIGSGCGKQVNKLQTLTSELGDESQENIQDSSGTSLKECIEVARITEVSLKIEDEILPQDKCYWMFAIEKKDPSLCEKISTKYRDGKSEYDFFSRCMYELAQETLDINLCVKAIGELKFNCINELTKTTGDPRFCNNQENRLLKNQCLTQVAKQKLDPGLCDSLQIPNESEPKTELDDWYNRDSCIDTVARDTRNPAHCELINEPELRSICRQIISPPTF